MTRSIWVSIWEEWSSKMALYFFPLNVILDNEKFFLSYFCFHLTCLWTVSLVVWYYPLRLLLDNKVTDRNKVIIAHGRLHLKCLIRLINGPLLQKPSRGSRNKMTTVVPTVCPYLTQQEDIYLGCSLNLKYRWSIQKMLFCLPDSMMEIDTCLFLSKNTSVRPIQLTYILVLF